MSSWTNVWLDKNMVGQMSSWTNVWLDKCLGWTNVWVGQWSGWTNVWLDNCPVGQTSVGQMSGGQTSVGQTSDNRARQLGPQDDAQVQDGGAGGPDAQAHPHQQRPLEGHGQVCAINCDK